MAVITRFAPSPTGLLHVGNIRTALISWLFSRSKSGKFILRIDDTDKIRSEQRYVDAIKRDLSWLGIEWDEVLCQSDRMHLYKNAKQKLIDLGRLYPCYETQEELLIKKKTLLNRNLPPIYDRASLKLTQEEKLNFEEKGINPHWRFLLDDSEILWTDEVRGRMHFLPSNLNDPILFRADGTMTYTLASVVDDIDFGITHVIRGEDHLSNSAVHIQIFRALGATPPGLAHTSLLGSKDKEISKRIGGFDIESLRNLGIEPMAINSFLAKIGSSDPMEYRFDLQQLIEDFDFKKLSKATANYDQLELERLNKKLIHHMPYDRAIDGLKEKGLDHIRQDFWDIIKGNISTLEDIKLWWKIYSGQFEKKLIDIDFTNQISEFLPPEPWDENTWNVWIKLIKENTKRSGKDLFMPIRLAITGQKDGPELKALLPILGKSKVLERLSAKN